MTVSKKVISYEPIWHLTDSGVQERLSDTLWIALLFAFEDGAGNKLQLDLKRRELLTLMATNTLSVIQAYIMSCYLCFPLWCDASHILAHHEAVVEHTQQL